jgi:hypothetical protein
MKKQLLILATVFATVVFVSCSKEKIETNEMSSNSEIATVAQRPSGSAASLNKGLIGHYEFDGNLKDKTGNLLNANPGAGNSPIYTADRKGFRGRAIKFDGTYGVTIHNVPRSIKMSFAAWVKYDSSIISFGSIANPPSGGPACYQFNNEYIGYNGNNASSWLSSGAINNKWHHIVVSLDGTFLRFFVDGTIINTKLQDGDAGLLITDYLIGRGQGSGQFWPGSMDDLRFYNRVLNASEVQTLFNL